MKILIGKFTETNELQMKDTELMNNLLFVGRLGSGVTYGAVRTTANFLKNNDDSIVYISDPWKKATDYEGLKVDKLNINFENDVESLKKVILALRLMEESNPTLVVLESFEYWIRESGNDPELKELLTWLLSEKKNKNLQTLAVFRPFNNGTHLTSTDFVNLFSETLVFNSPPAVIEFFGAEAYCLPLFLKSKHIFAVSSSFGLVLISDKPFTAMDKLMVIGRGLGGLAATGIGAMFNK